MSVASLDFLRTLTPDAIFAALAAEYVHDHAFSPPPFSREDLKGLRWEKMPLTDYRDARRMRLTHWHWWLQGRFPGFASDGCSCSPDWDIRAYCIFHDLLWMIYDPEDRRMIELSNRWLRDSIARDGSRKPWRKRWRYKWLAFTRYWGPRLGGPVWRLLSPRHRMKGTGT